MSSQFEIGDTVKDKIFGETFFVTGYVPWLHTRGVQAVPWFSEDIYGGPVFLESDLVLAPLPQQPDFSSCLHERRSFIGLVSGRWACAQCGEWLE